MTGQQQHHCQQNVYIKIHFTSKTIQKQQKRKQEVGYISSCVFATILFFYFLLVRFVCSESMNIHKWCLCECSSASEWHKIPGSARETCDIKFWSFILLKFCGKKINIYLNRYRTPIPEWQRSKWNVLLFTCWHYKRKR